MQYNVNKQSVGDLKKKKNEMLQFICSADSSSELKKIKIMKKSLYEDLDKSILNWCMQKTCSEKSDKWCYLCRKSCFFLSFKN